ncbi:hypothetical protein ACFQO8_09135 [Exiguobacterium aestuarii]|uniref:Uncharacterized protein n=1 Tax=Exiguobacterium aestuarii TaxID=273527 RepID=A0ABW2PM52_9BACL|nr:MULTISPECIES: hypothetical protein [Exiguobacterium]MCT4787211.1 hypothetical protein [Exiguobacterium aestuarii]
MPAERSEPMKQALREHPILWLWFLLSFGLGLFGIYLAFTDSVYTMSAVIASLFAFGFALQRTAKYMQREEDRR